MIYLILDTNIWVYMANGYNSITNSKGIESTIHFELYEKLKEKVDNREFTILTNPIILKEWQRNKADAKSNIAKLKEIKSKKIKELLTKNGELRDEVFKKEAAENNDYYDNLIEKNRNHIRNIEAFLTESTDVQISESVKVKLANLAMFKEKAPFKSNKNNFPDAAILFASIEYLNDNMLFPSSAVFVSYNFKDYGRKGSNTDDTTENDSFHEDLLEEIGDVNIQYHKHLFTLLDLTDRLQEDIEYFYELSDEEYEDNRILCLNPYCDEDRFGFPEVQFGCKIRIASDKEFLDPNQLSLFTLKKIDFEETAKFTLGGSCNMCYSNHIYCPKCSQLIIDINEDYFYYCEECQQGFKVGESLKNKDMIVYPVKDEEFHL